MWTGPWGVGGRWTGCGSDALTAADPTTAPAACKCLSTQKTRSFRAFPAAEICGFLPLLGQGCQRLQRLLKTLHRDDAQPLRVLPRVARVLPRRDEEGIHTRGARTDRLLLDAADRVHGAVRPDLAGRRDPVPVVDVAAELLEDLEREGEPGGGAADTVGVERDASLVEEDADDAAPRAVPGRDRPQRDRPRLAAAADREAHLRADGLAAHQAGDVLGRADAGAVDREDHIARREVPCRRQAFLDREDPRAGRDGRHLRAERAHPHGGAVLLRESHLTLLELALLPLVQPGRHDRRGRVEGGPVVEPAEEALEERRLAHDHV